MSESLERRITEELLGRVQGPGQYVGGEINQIKKDWQDCAVRVALGFPDTYGIGMSHLGLAILYEVLNRKQNVLAERVFCPWLDAEKVMRDKDIPLFSWESRRAVRDFDILGITLQHELSFSNVLYMLDLAGITARAEQRKEDEPLVMGGGPIADSCEPVAEFFDLIILGDGEDSLPAVIDAYVRLRNENLSRRELLIGLAREFEFVYVPGLYECDYNNEGRLTKCAPTVQGIPTCVQRAQVENLEETVFPTAPIVANTETVHDRIAIEVMRGCPGRCAFCHAGHTKGKLRWRSVEKIEEIAEQSFRSTGHDTISLLSLSTSDYPELRRLLECLYSRFEGCHVGISLPSLRVDKQLHEVPSQVTGVRREGLTVAVESASDRIRQAIGKQVTDADLRATMRAAFEAGWKKVKLYFMVGFPGETDEDILGILKLAADISALRREVCGEPASVNAAVSWLVPKPHTPLAWSGQGDLEYFLRAKRMLLNERRNLRKVNVALKFHHMERSILEAAFSRGDRRLSRVLESAYAQGARFDDWNECFSFERYEQAFRQYGLDIAFFAQRPRDEDEILPWDHLAGDNRPGLHRRWQIIQKRCLTQ